jgi:hypothetical protein
MPEWEIKGEVTPEELHKRFEEYENEPGYLKTMVIDYLMPYMVREILKTNADAMTKAQAIFYLGELYGALEGANQLELPFALTKKGPYEEMMKNNEYVLRSTAHRLIELYEDLKKGRPLDQIRDSLKYLAWDTEFSGIRSNAHDLLKYIEGLKPS